MNTWHASPADLAAYAAGSDDAVVAASVETHLLRCADCRAALARAAARGHEVSPDTDRRWEALSAVVDRPASTPLARLGLSTRPLAVAWGLALLFVLMVPVLPAAFVGVGVPTALLAMAPLVPTLGVALSYREASDPAGELALAAPLAGLRLVTRRAVAVAVAAVPVGVGLALLVGLPVSLAVAWLLPGLALSAVVLLAGTTRLDPVVVAAVLGGLWAVAVAMPAASRRIGQDVVVAAVTSPQTQLLALVVAAAAVALTVSRREHLAYRRTS
ncbi:zf-HC2 domain-containing protein [Nocardioides guangzhouensis]|uniref:Zf-HC2 domain-containing protein n=1 Tax=Nocardioides guangzhouensis TaxID=2497878 RepID=A0A4Q4YZV3_9ACTN|nr:zf-HC2 domain-containing protein [Nocardioides guangzhouensis]RYP80790.1 zf-HC2 domain-containing protein [Nocardioides guangzhouensis]